MRLRWWVTGRGGSRRFLSWVTSDGGRNVRVKAVDPRFVVILVTGDAFPIFRTSAGFGRHGIEIAPAFIVILITIWLRSCLKRTR